MPAGCPMVAEQSRDDDGNGRYCVEGEQVDSRQMSAAPAEHKAEIAGQHSGAAAQFVLLGLLFISWPSCRARRLRRPRGSLTHTAPATVVNPRPW
jgi:hypothetical protein